MSAPNASFNLGFALVVARRIACTAQVGGVQARGDYEQAIVQMSEPELKAFDAMIVNAAIEWAEQHSSEQHPAADEGDEGQAVS